MKWKKKKKSEKIIHIDTLGEYSKLDSFNGKITLKITDKNKHHNRHIIQTFFFFLLPFYTIFKNASPISFFSLIQPLGEK